MFRCLSFKLAQFAAARRAADLTYDKGGLRAAIRPATLVRYLERRRRRSTRTVIVTVITSTVITVTPMIIIGASFPPKRESAGPVVNRGRFV